MTQHNTIQQLSVDVQLIVKRLARCEVGELIKYSELSQLIGRNIQEKRDILDSARRVTQRDHKKVFGVVMNEGVKRLSDAEIAESWKPDVASIRRKCGRAARRISVADYEKLSDEQKRKANTGLAIVGVISHMSKPKNAEVIEGAVDRQPKRLDFSETVALFQK